MLSMLPVRAFLITAFLAAVGVAVPLKDHQNVMLENTAWIVPSTAATRLDDSASGRNNLWGEDGWAEFGARAKPGSPIPVNISVPPVILIPVFHASPALP